MIVIEIIKHQIKLSVIDQKKEMAPCKLVDSRGHAMLVVRR